MLIYVFYVNKGEMMTFDLRFALESVGSLQEVISREMGIPVESQVLLVSGGDTMVASARVSNYGTGMVESCPIFLFNLKAIEEKNPPSIMHNLDQDSICHRIEGSINMAPTLATLSTRTQLALELKDMSVERETFCKSLVHDQHLQQQGWRTVVISFEDSMTVFTTEVDKFVTWFQQLLDQQPRYLGMLRRFADSYKLLSKMPILTSLTDILKRPEYHDCLAGSTNGTLMQLFTALDSNEDLLTDASNAFDELSQLSAAELDMILAEKENALRKANNEDLKEVKGLEKRLYGLEQLIANAGQLVKDQEAYAQGFVHNQKRCRQLADPHVLPDLCISHKEQLRMMEDRDVKLRNISAKCLQAKRELCNNIHIRLRWIMYVQNQTASLQGRMSLMHQNCKRLNIRLNKLDQICRAPVVYAQLCVEVHRRQKSASEYTNWSQYVHSKSTEWRQKEVEHRKEFYRIIGSHFLKEFFPGLDRLPSVLVLSPIEQIIEEFPSISEEEITSLKDALPELEQFLQLPESSSHPLSVQCSLASGTGDPSPATPLSPATPDTPSDIAVLTPRTNQSSQHSEVANRAHSPVFNVSALQLTGPSSLETLSERILDLKLGGAPPLQTSADSSEIVVHAIDQSDSSVHMMARFEQFDDEDLSAATDDDHAPVSLNEENSGGFMTANFFLSDELESVSGNRVLPEEMADTITMKDGEIEKLTSENMSYRLKCDNLTSLIQHLAKCLQQEMKSLREKSVSARQDLHSQRTDFDTFQSLLNNAIQRVPALQKQEVDKQLSECRTAHSAQISKLTNDVAESKSERSNLESDVSKLQSNCDRLSGELTEAATNALERIRSAEAEVTNRLTLEHELELDQVKEDNVLLLQDKQGEIIEKDKEIKRLHSVILDLQKQLSSAASQSMHQAETVKKEFDSLMEIKLTEINITHEKEMSNRDKEFQVTLDDKLHKALADQKHQLEALHQHHMKRLVKPTADVSLNTEENYLIKYVEKVRAEDALDKSQAVEAAREEMRVKYEEQLKLKEEGFLEQATQQKLGQEEEFEYRAATMKQSLQMANEMKLEQKLNQLKKEKDSVINELKSMLSATSSAASGAAMAESVITLDQADNQQLEHQLLEKDSMIKALKAKVSSIEMSTSSRHLIESDKLAVKSCVKGDKVVLIYDDRYGHYIVFSLLAIIHFLHTDSIKTLELEPGADGRRKSWVIAEIVDKELCQTKKTDNRFNVPINTRFYRVKAKPWAPES